MTDKFFVSGAALPSTARVAGFRAREAMSELYRFEIVIGVDDLDFDHSAAVAQRMTFNLREGTLIRAYHGIIASIELVHAHDASAYYRVLMVPEFWYATQQTHSQVFVDEPIDAIIKAMLTQSGLAAADFDLRIHTAREPKEFVAQYKETNYAFISRWLEREGLYYFFEQGTDREKLVITDTLDIHEPCRGIVRYVALGGGEAMGADALTRFRSKMCAMPTNVQFWDHDYLNPAVDVKGEAGTGASGSGELALYGQNFRSSGDGRRLATLRAEAINAERQVHGADGDAVGLMAGYTFELDEHPMARLNKAYLVTSVEHAGRASGLSPDLDDVLGLDGTEPYLARLTVLPADVQYRAPERTPWPRIDGGEVAIVCGEATSEYGQIDEHGRYFVRILFDESDLSDGRASTRVRMLQSHAGATEGIHFPLRKSTQVLLVFEGGDPDRPLISGALPTALTPAPVIDGNHTLNIVRTGGDNELVFEDNAGHQYAYLSCPIQQTFLYMGDVLVNSSINPSYLSVDPQFNDFNLVLNSEGHAHFHVGGNQVIRVDIDLEQTILQNFTEHVMTGDVTYNYHKNWDVFVDLDYNTTVLKNVEVHVVENTTYKFDQLWTVIVGNTVDFHFKNQFKFVVDQLVDIKFKSTLDLTVTDATTLTFLNTLNVAVTAATTIEYKDTLDLTVTKKTHYVHNADVLIDYNTNLTVNDVGNTSNNFWGFKNTFHGGMETKFYLGLKNQVILGMKNTVVAGAKVDAVLAKIDFSIFSAKATQIEMKAVASRMETAGIWLGCHLLDLKSAIMSIRG